MDKRKPRHDEIRVDFGRPQVLSGIHVADDGTLTLEENGSPVSPAYVEVGLGYQRDDKPPKALVRMPTDTNAIQLDCNRGLLRYAHVFAIDTNTRDVNGRRTSVAASIYVTALDVNSAHWTFTPVEQLPFEFMDPAGPPERVGWLELAIRVASVWQPGESIALIVDSELDRLRAINARTEPLVGEALLPEGITLIYGCGDRATTELVTNAAVAHCDRLSTAILAKHEAATAHPYFDGTRFHCGRYRYWSRSHSAGTP